MKTYENGTAEDKFSTYTHEYTYTGVIDTSFIDRYDVIFMIGCNEYGIELCKTALPLWSGKRLVLVSPDWNDFVEDLPDLPGKECYTYDAMPDDATTLALINGMKPLYVMYGIPHLEDFSRYEQGIMYYDEVMSFTFLFSDKRRMGDLNPDKKFFVTDCDYSNLGLFAIYANIETISRYVKAKGFIPVVRLTRSDNSFYSDFSGDDIYAKFYEQPEDYSLDEVMHSQNVYFSPRFYTGSVQHTLMGNFAGDTTLTWPHGKYNDAVEKYISEREKRFLPHPDETLGVLARGTDYVHTHMSNHPVHASLDMICEKIDEMMTEDPALKYIYVSTEDASYIDYLKNRYGDMLYYTDQERYSVRDGESLTHMHLVDRQLGRKRAGFDLGAEYILSINLLSRCRSLIASGGCAGLGEAQTENAGRYRQVYVFDLGRNK